MATIPQAMCAENMTKFGHVVFEVSEWKQTQTKRQTYRHVDHNALST